MYCTVCGRLSTGAFGTSASELRETGACSSCGATNRQRQLAYVVCRVAQSRGFRSHSLRSMGAVAGGGLSVYNTESRGPVHDALRKSLGYLSSEYLTDDAAPGAMIGGVRHEDLRNLSLPDESFDVVLSSDVLEHVPDPYRAHREIYRVLKPGGRHVFTVPFHQNGYHDELRATVDSGGLHHLADPIYHSDPLREQEGALVYTIFGLEMLTKLRDIGFVPHLYQLYAPWFGILGMNAIVFEAAKVPWDWS